MFGIGKVLLEGIAGKEVPCAFAFALGERLGRRCHYGATRLVVMQWICAEDWAALREWLLKDLPGEEPLPVIREEGYPASPGTPSPQIRR